MSNVHASDVLHTLFRSVIGEDVIETSPPPSRNGGVDPAKGIEAQVDTQRRKTEEEWPSTANDDSRLFMGVAEGVT